METAPIAASDLTWLNMDLPTNLMVVNGLMWFDQEPAWDAVRDVLRSRLVQGFPVMAQRPLRDGSDWVWQDDPDFDFDRHVRHVTLPVPGDRAVAQDYISGRVSQPLDREHPLWEFDLISGYTNAKGGEGALILARFHHVLADGIRIVQLILGLCDVDEDAAPPTVGRAPHARNPVSMVAGAARNVVGDVASFAGDVASAARLGGPQGRGHRWAVWAGHLLRGLWPGREAHEGHRRAHCVVLGGQRRAEHVAIGESADPVGPRVPALRRPGTRVAKRVSWLTGMDLDQVKAVGRRARRTVNDVLLGAVSLGLSAYLRQRGRTVPPETNFLVPVSLKPIDMSLPEELGNHFAMVMFPMPLGITEVDALLAEVRARMARIKNSAEAMMIFGVQRAVAETPQSISQNLTRFVANKSVGLLTNVPGPRAPIYLAGHEVGGDPGLGAYLLRPEHWAVHLQLQRLCQHRDLHRRRDHPGSRPARGAHPGRVREHGRRLVASRSTARGRRHHLPRTCTYLTFDIRSAHHPGRTTVDPMTLDRCLQSLSRAKDGWARLTLLERIRYLEQVRDLLVENADAWVAAGVRLKGLDPRAPIVGGEEWLGGPYPTAAWLTDMIATLTRLSVGADPLEGVRVRTRPDGQVIARVFPANVYDRLLLNGYELDVWMRPGVTPGSLRGTVASFYRDADPPGGVTLVLGAGNVAAIPMLDALYCLFVDGHVVVLKMNPVNEAYGPVFARVLEPLIRDGYLVIVYGGADVGERLTGSDLVDMVHITGSERTHDTIVFGPGAAGQQAKAEGRPRFVKPIRSELGGVSPTIVVPGPWSRADIAYQAQHLATQKLFSAGHTCVASQVLILSKGWAQKGQLLDALRSALSEAPNRSPFYPGTQDRQDAFRAANPDAEALPGPQDRTLLVDVEPDSDHPGFHEEMFGPIYLTTAITSADPGDFLADAVAFANERLHGNLGANILIHPTTAKELGPELEQAIADLRFGCIGVNVWSAFAFLSPRAAGRLPRQHRHRHPVRHRRRAQHAHVRPLAEMRSASALPPLPPLAGPSAAGADGEAPVVPGQQHGTQHRARVHHVCRRPQAHPHPPHRRSRRARLIERNHP